MSKFTKEMVDSYADKLLIGLTPEENELVDWDRGDVWKRRLSKRSGADHSSADRGLLSEDVQSRGYIPGEVSGGKRSEIPDQGIF